MFRKPLFFVLLTPIAFLFSCVATKTLTAPPRSNGSAESYIETYKDLAMSEMKRTGVPASITLAQGMIESGLGRGSLAVEANNHFGIKCHDDWTGPTVRHNDDRRNECFRKYRKVEESFQDHSDFLRTERRYGSLFELEPTDYKAWARGLKKAGYATNPDYANMLIRKIEQYNLTDYDRGRIYSEKQDKEKPMVISKIADTVPPVIDPSVKQLDIGTTYRVLPARVKENNRIQYIIVKEKDTKKNLEAEFQLLPWELQRYNELKADFTLTPGQMLYLQPKRDKADAGNDYHVVRNGETMYSISQVYGIKLNKLYLMNRMKAGEEPTAGQKLWLRTIRPVD
jgi:LysM repeat protein